MDARQPESIVLLPQPRRLTRLTGTYSVSGVLRIRGNPEPIFEPALLALRSLLEQRANSGAVVSVTRRNLKPQSYHLSIEADGISIEAADGAGAFYAVQTLLQLLRQFPTHLPCLRIEDEPDFPVRCVMLDISRDKVPTMATLLALIDQFAEWKINQLQLYMEHTFAYSQHRRVWQDASPMTAEEIRKLDEYCRARFIELVPNQNSFGHMERWLKHPEYQHLAEVLDGADTPFGYRWKGPFSLCPTDPGSVNFLRGLYAELLPNFSSKLFNVGCDETFDIGQGRSKAECDRRGVTQVYLEFLKKVNGLVRENGRTMMFWGDIIIHKPELIARTPKDVIALEWGHEADHPFDRDGGLFAEAGVPFYVCPGTSSWNSIAGRTANALANLKSAAVSGLKHGAIGYLNTDWGDYGHLQYLPVSYLGFVAGACYSWCMESNAVLDIVEALNAHAFLDPSAVLGKLAYDLGNVYQLCSKQSKNGSALFRVLVPPPNDSEPERGLTMESLQTCERVIEAAMSPLNLARSIRPDASLIADEFCNAAAILRHAIQLTRAKLRLGSLPAIDRAIVDEHRRLWLARNRPGGLDDSCGRLGTTA